MIRRRLFVTAAASLYATLGISRFSASAAEFEYKWATENPANAIDTTHLIAACTKINQDSNGRLNIRVFPNSVLANTTQQVVMVRSGAIEFITGSDLQLTDVVTVVGMTAVPFAFSGSQQALSATAGPMGQAIRSAIASKIDVYSMAQSWDYGFRHVCNAKKPINTPDDLKGLKIRTPDSPIITATFSALGASPTTIQSSEMYLALQTHLADGAELPLDAIDAFKLNEVLKYVSYTNHVWTAKRQLANGAAWRKLPANLRDMVERNLNDAGVQSNREVEQRATALEATLRGKGMLFNQVDVAQFRAILRRAGLYVQWRDKFGADAWALLERSVGKLT